MSNTDKTAKTVSAPENAQVSWTDWHNLLTPEEEHQAAMEVGFARFGGGYDMSKAERFEALVEFRRSMRLFDNLSKQ